MTSRANARVAGVLFLLYIATGIVQVVLFSRAVGADGAVAVALAAWLVAMGVAEPGAVTAPTTTRR